jgi:hypothetical protein
VFEKNGFPHCDVSDKNIGYCGIKHIMMFLIKKATSVLKLLTCIIISILAILSISTPITTNILNIKPNIICYIGAILCKGNINIQIVKWI